LFLKFPLVHLRPIILRYPFLRAVNMKEKIIQKATEQFLNLGFKSVTMDDIASELGISKKTIYTHFNNKTALVKAVTMEVFDTISCSIDEIRKDDHDPIEELYEVKNFVMKRLKDEKTSPQYQLQKYYPEIYKTLTVKRFEKMHECTVQNLQKGKALGLYREHVDIDFISKIYFVGISGIKDETLFPIHEYPKTQLFEDYLEYHLRAIVTPAGLQTLNKFIKATQTNE